MPLEDLTGTNKFINAFDKNSPATGDGLSQGDDHTRGIKNVLLNTFPNVTGAVTGTQARLNDIPIPNASQILFRDAAVPAGYTLVTGMDDRFFLATDTASQGRDQGGAWAITGFGGNVGSTALTAAQTGLYPHEHTFTPTGGPFLLGAHGSGPVVGGDSFGVVTGTVGGGTTTGGSAIAATGHAHAANSITHDGTWRARWNKILTCQKVNVT